MGRYRKSRLGRMGRMEGEAMSCRRAALTILTSLVAGLLFAGSPDRAFGASEVPNRVERGILGCEGFFGPLFGNQLGTASYALSNFNSTATITIESIRVHSADGTPVASAPPFPAGFDAVLGPHQRTQFSLQGLGLTSAVGQVQVIITYAVTPEGLPLTGGLVRRDLGLDAFGNFSVIRGLAFLQCLDLELR